MNKYRVKGAITVDAVIEGIPNVDGSHILFHAPWGWDMDSDFDYDQYEERPPTHWEKVGVIPLRYLLLVKPEVDLNEKIYSS